jgi:hypothetical protein
MKMQIEGQHLRVRIDEDELTRLLAGNVIQAHTQFAEAFAIDVSLYLTDTGTASVAGKAHAWQIALPQGDVREHADRLPTREGLRFVLATSVGEEALTLLFDVDVRDSVRRRRSS